MKKRTVVLLWSAALLVLAAVLVFVNLPAAEPAVPGGAQVGQRLPDFTVPCLDGSDFTLSAQRGKVTVINLWATWCTPCVRELPNFDRLLQERPEEVAVLAVHSPPVTTDVADWLSADSYAMPFAVDGDGSLSALLEASTVLPQTVIVDPDGVVRCRHTGSLTYEALCELVNAAAP